MKRRKKAKEPLHIIFAASECLHFQKTGGLSDVTARLPKELAALGHTVEIYIPLYLKALLYPIDHGTPLRHNTEFSQVRVRLSIMPRSRAAARSPIWRRCWRMVVSAGVR